MSELMGIADEYIHGTAAPSEAHTTTSSSNSFTTNLKSRYKAANTNAMYVDKAWQAIASSQCLFDCVDSPTFTLRVAAPL
jgi:hypothetical protein